jgi:exonuclease SbcC
MRLLRIELRNFKPFKHLILPENGAELPQGLILIRGPNSTGKSSLFEGILWALWGADAVGLDNDELVNFTSTHCSVKLEFEVAGTPYRIHREYNPAEGSSVVLFNKKGSAWKPVANKTRSVKTKMDEILSLELKQALQTLLVRQGEVALIANATPTVLRKLLEGIYDIDLLKQMERHLGYMEKDIDIKVEALRQDYISPEQVQEIIKDSRERIQELRDSALRRNAEIESAEEAMKGIPDAKSLKKISRLESNIERYTSELGIIKADLEKDLTQAGFLDADIALVKARLKSLEKVRAKIEEERSEANEEIERVAAERGRINGTRADLEEKIEDLKGSGSGDDGKIVCPTCSKPLTPKERDRLVVEYEQTIKNGVKRKKELEKRRTDLLKDLKKSEKRLEQTARSEDATNRVKSTHDRLSKAESRIEKASTTLSEILSEIGVESVESLLSGYSVDTVEDLRLKVEKLKNEAKNLRENIKEIEERVKKEETRIKDLEDKKESMTQMGQDIQELTRLREHAEYVRKKLVTGFVADYIFQKRLIGIIRSATNQYIRFFTNGQYTSIDLEPVRRTKASGSGLLLKIWDERDQAWKKSTQLSFGDRTAISLGLRLGISRTMSSIRPLKDSPIRMPRVRSVLLDEPLGGLDKTRRESVVRNLINDQSFEQIFLITHTDVQGWEGVPAIEIAKDGSSSSATLVT